jgi:hypothetical protein
MTRSRTTLIFEVEYEIRKEKKNLVLLLSRSNKIEVDTKIAV